VKPEASEEEIDSDVAARLETGEFDAVRRETEEFERLGLRAGTIRKVERFPEARKPAYKVWVDFGPLGIR